MTRLRTIAACDAAAAEQFAPWREDASVKAWRAVQSITPEIARQEPQAIAEMIAHLRGVQGGAA
jgi:hypothetical protein